VADFIGKYEYSVDPKGRVNIPAKFRKALSPEAEETFIIVRASENCLRAYPKDTWAKYKAKLFALPNTPENLKFKRMISSTSSDSALDVQGRIMLTATQMELARITREVTILGLSDYIELWDTARFKEYAESKQDFDFDKAFYAVEAELAGLP
jgi:MraZ protein